MCWPSAGWRRIPTWPTWRRWREAAEASDLRCADAAAAEAMRAHIRRAAQAGDTLGGVIQVIATGLPVGLGSHVHWDRRLDGQLAGALMSIPAIKGVEFGLGFAAAGVPGSEVHDALYAEGPRIVRKTNHAGGLEGGITNGEPLVMQVAMKPIPTLSRPLPSVDMSTGGAVAGACGTFGCLCRACSGRGGRGDGGVCAHFRHRCAVSVEILSRN